MSGFFAFDIETLGLESTCIIPSAAIVYADLDVLVEIEDPNILYQKLLDDSLFVKFDIHDQKEHGRSISKSTLDFWEEQDKNVREKSLKPSTDDLLPIDGLRKMREYIKSKQENNYTHVYIRGNLDSLCVDSLAETYGVEPIVHWGRYRDFRTIIDVMYGTNNGYCEVPGFNKELVKKHDPVHDIAYDILMVIKGKSRSTARRLKIV